MTKGAMLTARIDTLDEQLIASAAEKSGVSKSELVRRVVLDACETSLAQTPEPGDEISE